MRATSIAVHHDQLVALRGCRKCQDNSRVAGCRFDNGCNAGRDLTGLLGRLDHRQTDAILHRIKRIEEL
jgi:hypothetical protein